MHPAPKAKQHKKEWGSLDGILQATIVIKFNSTRGGPLEGSGPAYHVKMFRSVEPGTHFRKPRLKMSPAFRCLVPLTVAVKTLVIFRPRTSFHCLRTTQLRRRQKTSETNALNCREVSESSNEVSWGITVRPLLAFILKAKHNNSNDKQSLWQMCSECAVCSILGLNKRFSRVRGKQLRWRLQSTVIRGRAESKKSSLKSNKIGKQHLHTH